ncbi:MAG TPA: Holliday junction resolvase RuvX, partial [Mycobacterium sp.]|nr:Holliday junction resolvase RuvX [Mycobacterium sp.]
MAVGQELTRTASPLTTVFFVRNRPDWDRIAELIDAWKPDAVVIGVPYHMDGSEHQITAAARKFGRQLQARFGLPVYEADERLSSREARARTVSERMAGERKRIRKGDIDQLAAQIILADWLRQQEGGGD